MYKTIKRILNIKRYFIISYSFKNGNGYVEIINNFGKYPNKKWFSEYMTKELKSNDIDSYNIVIDNIIELSRKDYIDFLEDQQHKSSRKAYDM